jgi:hypothetical protein
MIVFDLVSFSQTCRSFNCKTSQCQSGTQPNHRQWYVLLWSLVFGARCHENILGKKAPRKQRLRGGIASPMQQAPEFETEIGTQASVVPPSSTPSPMALADMLHAFHIAPSTSGQSADQRRMETESIGPGTNKQSEVSDQLHVIDGAHKFRSPN